MQKFVSYLNTHTQFKVIGSVQHILMALKNKTKTHTQKKKTLTSSATVFVFSQHSAENKYKKMQQVSLQLCDLAHRLPEEQLCSLNETVWHDLVCPDQWTGFCSSGTCQTE